jgi:hypothetical protein
MKKYLIFILFTLAGSFSFITILNAQITDDSTAIWRVVIDDGNEFYGKIYEETDNYIRLQTENVGLITIQRKNIELIELLAEARIKEGKVWLENLQATRYFWAPNGYGLEKGEGYYQNVWVLFNQASVGITDNFSIGAGLIPLFLFDFQEAPTPVFIVPKFSFPIKRNKVNLGGGAIVGTILGGEGLDEIGPFGIAYGVVTIGDKDMNGTLGVGYGFADGELSKYPILTVGGMKRIARRSYLLTENYFIKGQEFTAGLIAIGGRTVWQRISLDYGLVIPVSDELESFIAIPWMSLSVPFQY